MPINVSENSSHDNNNKIDTSIFVQKPYIRANYIENNMGEDFDFKNQYGNKNLPCPVKHKDAVCKSYVDSGLNDPCKIRKRARVDFKDKKT